MSCCKDKVPPAKLRYIFSVREKSRVGDGGGGGEIEWIEVATVRGSLTPASGKEVYRAMNLKTEVTHKIMMRYHQEVKPKNQLVLIKDGEERLFNIKQALNIEEQNQWLDILVEEGVAQ